jgi:hypothetical protein
VNMCVVSGSRFCCYVFYLATLSISRPCSVGDRIINENGADGGRELVGETEVL